MVGLEGNRDKKNARLIGQTANECSSELEQKEKEIERKLLIAEKDKRETMYSLDCIKKLTDQFQALVDDFKLDVSRDEISLDFSLPPSVIDTIERRRNSMHGTGITTTNGMNVNGINGMATIESNNDSPNGSPNRPAHFYSLHTSHSPNHSPSSSSNNHSSLSSNNHFMHSPLSSVSAVENHTELLKAKEAELKRVTMRAQQESAKATFFRKRKDELQQRLSTEVESRRNTIKITKQNIAYKEKEISRLSFLAEQDKKTGMFLCQQIAQLKKSIEGFLQAREESKPETLCNILTRCASSSDFYTSPPSSPLHNSSYLRVASTMRTPLGRETEALLLEDDKKTQELARVKCIVEQESKRVDSLKLKVEELKQGLVAELQEADEQLEQKMQEFVQKQLAIEKVQARAERERARSLFLKNEIINLGNALGVGRGRTRKGKGDEYAPDVAYLSEFSDLCDLETSAIEPTPETLKDGEVPTTPTLSSSLSSSTSSSVSTHASSLPLSIATNLRTRDPSMYVFSPPCRTIPISPASEGIYMQKLKDIAVLNRETTKKDEELARLKRLAEAERCRHLLLKDKFDQLHQDLRDRQLGHTY